MTNTGSRTKQSRYSFAETVSELSKAIAHAGNTVFATIDQAAAASGVGLALRPTTLILFGNPAAGTPLMDAFPLVALELPLKLLVWQQQDAVNVTYVPMSEIAKRYGLAGAEARVMAMDRALDTLTDAVSRA